MGTFIEEALKETAAELALVKTIGKSVAAQNSVLTQKVEELSAKITALTDENEKLEQKEALLATFLKGIGFDAAAVSSNGFWSLFALEHIRCSIELSDFVGPTLPGNMHAIHTHTAKQLISGNH